MSRFIGGRLYTGSYFQIVGPDGVGKTSAIDWLRKQFGREKYVFVREPGGTPLAEEFRNSLKSEPLSTEKQLSLMWSARFSLFSGVVAPAIESGKIVISDRGDACSAVYQDLFHENVYGLLEFHMGLRERLYNHVNASGVLCSIVPNYIFLQGDAGSIVESLAHFRSQKDLFDGASVSVVQKRNADYKRYAEKLKDSRVAHSWSTVPVSAPYNSNERAFREIALAIANRYAQD